MRLKISIPWKILGNLIGLIIILHIPAIPITVKICVRILLIVILITFLELNQKFLASYPISLQTALTYLVSRFQVVYSFYYVWYTLERITFYFPRFVESNFNKNPNITCALLFHEAFTPVILLAVLFIIALHSYATLYTSKYLGMNHERLYFRIVTVLVIVGLFEVVSTLILNGGFCRPKKVERLVKDYQLNIDLNKFPPSQSPPYTFITIFMCILTRLITIVIQKRRNKIKSSSGRNRNIPVIPTISEHNRQVLMSGSVFGQNNTQAKSIDLTSPFYPQLLKVKSSESSTNSYSNIETERPVSVPLKESNSKPKTLRRKSESNHFILSPNRLTKIYPIADDRNLEISSEKSSTEDNSSFQNEHTESSIKVASVDNTIFDNNGTDKQYRVNYIEGAKSNVDFITPVAISNALLLGSNIPPYPESQLNMNDFMNIASRSKENVRRGQVQTIERSREDNSELLKQFSNKYILQGILSMLVTVILFRIQGQNNTFEFYRDLVMVVLPVFKIVINEYYVEFVARKIMNNFN